MEARRGQKACHFDKAVDIVGPAMQKNDSRTICRAVFGVSNIEEAGIDLLQ